MKKLLLPILFVLITAQGFSQRNPYLDSLWNVWSDASQPDTTRLKAMYDFAWDGFLYSQPDSSYYFSKQMYDYAQKKGLKKFQAQAKNLQFSYFFMKGDLVEAEKANNLGMIFRTELKDPLGMAVVATNFGILYQVQGNYQKAIEYYTLSLKYNEEAKNKAGIGTSLHNIGHVYQDQADHKKALEYYYRALKMRTEVGDAFRAAETHVNIGSVLTEMGDYETAMSHLEKSLVMSNELGNRPGQAAALGNIGMIYQATKAYDKALDYYSRSLAIQLELGDPITTAISYVNIGRLYMMLNEDQKAISFLEKGLKLAKDANDATGVKTASGNLSAVYKKVGRYKEALEMHELFLTMSDSLGSLAAKKELARQEFKYEYEKKATADSIKAAGEKKVVEAQFRQEQTTRYALYIGVALLCIFGVFMFSRFRESQKQNAIIERQKVVVEQKQQEILDSIHYARRIQSSLMPTDKYIDKQIKRLKKS